jgi:hypothetical protein
VDVILTFVAVTAPVAPDDPTALTQSPLASEEAVVAWVAEYVVDFVVVTLRFCFFVLGFLPFDALPILRSVPETETVEPFTAVTLPLAMETAAPPDGALPVPPPPKPPGRPPPPPPP